MYNKMKPPVKKEFEMKAWFQCKFLCRELTEENFEMARAHVSVCPGTKTKIKLNYAGWTVGNNIIKKNFVDFFPLSAIDNLCQDTQFVNVIFLIMRLADKPSQIEQKYEILAYKLMDQKHARMFQNVFQNLTGQHVPVGLSRMSTSMGNLTLVPTEWRSQSSVYNVYNDQPRRMVNGNQYIYDMSQPQKNMRLNDYRRNGSQDEDTSISVGSSDYMGHKLKYNGYDNNVRRVVKESIDSSDQSWSPDEGVWSEKNSKWSNGVVNSRTALSSESSISSDEVPTTIVYGYNGNYYNGPSRTKYSPSITDPHQHQMRNRGMLEVPQPQYRSKNMMQSSSRSDIYNDASSVRSNNVYLLNPKFKKTYAYRQ